MGCVFLAVDEDTLKLEKFYNVRGNVSFWVGVLLIGFFKLIISSSSSTILLSICPTIKLCAKCGLMHQMRWVEITARLPSVNEFMDSLFMSRNPLLSMQTLGGVFYCSFFR